MTVSEEQNMLKFNSHTAVVLTLLPLFISTASFAVNDNYTENNTYSPTGGSLSNNLSADGNSANNNGSISSSSSAFANKLDSSITGVQRFDTSNNQLGNSHSSSSLGNISNNSAGGAGGSSISNSGGNTLSNGQGQSLDNNNMSAGNNTNVNTPVTLNQSSVTRIPRQAPALPAQVNVQAPGTAGGNFSISTPFGGAGFGLNRTVAEMKTLFISQAEQVSQIANSQYIENIKEACSIISAEECSKLKAQMVRRLGISVKKK